MRCLLTSVVAILAATPAWSQLPYESEMLTWFAQDQLNPPPDNAILFVGSSSIRRWEHLSRDFADYDIIQRGFGGSRFTELNLWVNQLVLPYDPAAIVVFEGTNDISAGASAQTVFTDYLAFVNMVHSGQSQTRPPIPILFIGITPTPARWALWSVASQANAMIENHAQTDPALFYIDTPTPFLATGSPPSSSLFVSDGLHLNTEGYELWSSIIRPSVLAASPPTKNYTRNSLTPQTGDRLLFDFGPDNSLDGNPTPSPDANGNHWNNWHSVVGGTNISAGEHIGDLVTTSGAQTGIDLVITGGYLSNGIRNGGLLAPNPALLGKLAIATATQDYFFFTGEDSGGGFLLNGLDRTLTYDLHFFASRDTGETRITRFTAAGACRVKTTDLQTSGTGIGANGTYRGNDDEVAVLAKVHPDRFGQVFIDTERVAASFGYIGAMEIVVGTPQPCDLGDGCGPIRGVLPAIAAPNPHPGSKWTITATGFSSGAFGGLFVSMTSAPNHGPGRCRFYVSSAATLITHQVDNAGHRHFVIPIPRDSALVGVEIAAQAVYAGPVGLETSNGLQATVCR